MIFVILSTGMATAPTEGIRAKRSNGNIATKSKNTVLLFSKYFINIRWVFDIITLSSSKENKDALNATFTINMKSTMYDTTKMGVKDLKKFWWSIPASNRLVVNM